MINEWRKMLGLLAFALAISGCSGGGSGDDTVEVADVPMPSDDAVVSVEAELSDGAIASADGVATPVESVSSGQLDRFIDNPLVNAIPAELDGSASNGVSASYIANPMMN